MRLHCPPPRRQPSRFIRSKRDGVVIEGDDGGAGEGGGPASEAGSAFGSEMDTLSGEPFRGRAVEAMGSGRCAGYGLLAAFNYERVPLGSHCFPPQTARRDISCSDEIPAHTDGGGLE